MHLLMENIPDFEPVALKLPEVPFLNYNPDLEKIGVTAAKFKNIKIF